MKENLTHSSILFPLFRVKKETLYNIFIHWAGIVLIVSMFSFNWISYDMGLATTKIIGVIDLYIFLLCLVLLIVRRADLSKEMVVFLALSGILVIYSLSHAHGLGSTLRGFKDYFTAVWLYVFFRHFCFQERTITSYVKVLTVLILLQLPIQLLQFITLRDTELCSGTFGYHQTGVMGIFMIGIVWYILSVKKLTVKNIVLIIYFSVSAFIGSAKIFFILNFFFVPFLLICRYKKKIFSKLSLVIVFCVVFFVFLQVNQIFYRGRGDPRAYNPFFYLTKDYYRSFFEDGFQTNPPSRHLNRGGALVRTYLMVRDESRLLLGRGVGWNRNLSPLEREKFKEIGIVYDFPVI
ncbi:MAG: hypothetical protein JSW40_04690, partial [Candidatus Omnitrophota bacterium]